MFWLLVSSVLLMWAVLAVAAVVGTALVRADDEAARWLSVPGCICGWLAVVVGVVCYSIGRGSRP